MISFILWYFIGGAIIGVIAMVYSIIYMARHGIPEDDCYRINKALSEYISLEKLLADNINKILLIILNVFSIILLPFLLQFYAYYMIRITDYLVSEQKKVRES